MNSIIKLLIVCLFLFSTAYSQQTKNVTIHQETSANEEVHGLKNWLGTQWSEEYNSGSDFDFQIDAPQVILANQSIHFNQKYNNWEGDLTNVVNHYTHYITTDTDELWSNFLPTHTGIIIKNSLEGTSLSFDNNIDVKFKDPWYIDYPDPLYANKPRNRGMSGAIFYNFTNSFSPTGDYKGIFLNQSGPEDNWVGTYYKVGTPNEFHTSSVHGENRSFYFGKWSAILDGDNDSTAQFQDNAAFETGVVFRNENAVVNANMKGERMSDSFTGISNNCQRKFVQGDDASKDTYIVYESMNEVWLDPVIDFVWYPVKLATNAKNPSIDIFGDDIFIVYEKLSDGEVYLGYIRMDRKTAGIYGDQSEETLISTDPSMFGELKPVISCGTEQQVIIFRSAMGTPLEYRVKRKVNSSWFWGAGSGPVPNTNEFTTSWSIAGNKSVDHNFVHSQSNRSVWYMHIDARSDNVRFCSFRNLSAGTGFNYNQNPSISCFKIDPFYSFYEVLVSWTGIISPAIEKTNEGFPSSTMIRHAAVSRVGYGGDNDHWPAVWSDFGENVEYTNNNSFSLSNNPSYGSVIAFSTDDGQSVKYTKRYDDGSYSTIASLDHAGIQPLVCNGQDFSEIKAMVFNTSTDAPYLINQCGNDFSSRQISKDNGETGLNITFGRTGSLVKEGVEFIFNIGDVEVDNEIIRFIEAPDTLPINTISDLNDALKSNTFQLNSQSEILFSNYYYVLNHEEAPSILSDDFVINASIRLINASTNEVTGIFDPVQYTSQNTDMHNYRGYEIDCSGIEPGEYYMELHLSCDESMNYYLGRIQREETLLAKGSLIKKSFTGGEIPVSCRLEQNYPNPFNPATTISYYLPEEGKVTLKIYDILGSEVATLVNELKEKGAHRIKFDGSALTSGVYIYRMDVEVITGNKFSEAKKLVLLK